MKRPLSIEDALKVPAALGKVVVDVGAEVLAVAGHRGEHARGVAVAVQVSVPPVLRKMPRLVDMPHNVALAAPGERTRALLGAGALDRDPLARGV